MDLPENEHRTYVIKRKSTGVECVVMKNGNQLRRLPWPQYHSPTGFEFGYGGSGPADLALAILIDFFGENEMTLEQIRWGEGKAIKHHQQFKWDFIATIPRDWKGDYRLSERTIIEWLNQQS